MQQVSKNTAVAASDALGGFVTQFEDSLAQKQQQLLQQVGALVAQFTKEQEATVSGMVAGLQQHLVGGQQQVEAVADEVEAATTSCIETLEVRVLGFYCLIETHLLLS
jgi:hypothetical protein